MNLYDLLRSKKTIRNTYRLIKGIIRTTKRALKKKKADNIGYTIQLKRYKNVFFGYYDKSPFNIDNEDIMLVHANNAISFLNPNPNVLTDILLVNWKTNEIIKKIGNTYSWNWQQGARAHWLDNENIIYNYYDELSNKYKSKLFNIYTDKETDLPIPVQESHKSGLIYSLSYEALNLYRPDYGYRNHSFEKLTEESNSILMYDINTKKTTTLVHLKDLLEKANNLYKNSKGQIVKAKVNHILSSSDGEKIVFLFRYYLGHKRITDLYLLNIRNKSLKLLLNDRNVSHYAWRNSDQLIYTGYGNKGFGYYLIDIKTNDIKHLLKFGDGHPYIMSDNEMIIDTYPDKFSQRYLFYACDIEKNAKVTKISSYNEPFLYFGETRCDLHPSLSNSKKYLQIDTIQNYTRKIKVIEMEEVNK